MHWNDDGLWPWKNVNVTLLFLSRAEAILSQRGQHSKCSLNNCELRVSPVAPLIPLSVLLKKNTNACVSGGRCLDIFRETMMGGWESL